MSVPHAADSPSPTGGGGSRPPPPDGDKDFNVDRTLVIRLNEPSDGAGKGTPPIEWVKAVATPIVTVLITLIGGHYLSQTVKESETIESNERLYAQLLTQREQSDALVRKDMFGVVINKFMAETSRQDWRDKVLQLELLANNFNQSLELSPLFKDIAARLPEAGKIAQAERTSLDRRLNQAASNLVIKQVSSLSRRGLADEGFVHLNQWTRSSKENSTIVERTIPKSLVVPGSRESGVGKGELIRYSVEIIGMSRERKEVEVRLRIDFQEEAFRPVDTHFWVSRFDFPMLENRQLPFGLRAAVAITDYEVSDAGTVDEDHSVQLAFVLFPAASASFKERQDYDDILIDMLRGRAASKGAADAAERPKGQVSQPR